MFDASWCLVNQGSDFGHSICCLVSCQRCGRRRQQHHQLQQQQRQQKQQQQEQQKQKLQWQERSHAAELRNLRQRLLAPRLCSRKVRLILASFTSKQQSSMLYELRLNDALKLHALTPFHTPCIGPLLPPLFAALFTLTDSDHCGVSEVRSSRDDESSLLCRGARVHAQLQQRSGGGWDQLVGSLEVWPNDGNGSCSLHAAAHAGGLLPRTPERLTNRQEMRLREVVVDGMVSFVYQGRFMSLKAYRATPSEQRRLTSKQRDVAVNCLRLLDIHRAPCDREAAVIEEKYSSLHAWLPATAFALLAPMMGLNFVIMQPGPGDKHSLCTMAPGRGHLAFAPAAGLAEHTCFVLYGRHRSMRKPLGKSNANHFEHLHAAGTAEPVTAEEQLMGQG